MAKIDTEKFIVDILQQLMEGHPLKVNILYALLKQGLVYTDGSIVRIVNKKDGKSLEEAITNEPIITKEPDFVAMADKYYNEVLIGKCKYPEPFAGHYKLGYYQGLKDMYNKMKK